VNIECVISLFGNDQSGIIEALSDAVADVGGNWQESHMSRLAGRFSGVVSINVPEAREKDLEAALHSLGRDGLELRLERNTEGALAEDLIAIDLDLVGHDRPGIVHEIASALSDKGVNIVELETRCSSAPMSGEMHFRAHAELLCPPQVSIDELREAVEQVGTDLMVDVKLGPSEES
jgi:glycine cleavage system regulatory protein